MGLTHSSPKKPGASVTTTVEIPAEALTIVAPPPATLSQRNVEQTTGIPARTFLKLVRAPEFPLKVVKLGKLRLVDRAAFLSWLQTQAATARTATDGVDDVLKEVGLTPRRPGSR